MKILLSLLLIIQMWTNGIFAQNRGAEPIFSTTVFNEQKIAFVIGNGDYKESPLNNPLNDARDIAETLTALGFKVRLRLNIDRKDFNNEIRDFGSRLQSGGVGLFFFAGHGIQVNGQNYLLPIGVDIRAEHEVDDEAVNVGRVLGEMNKAQNRLNIVILDACRNNPFARYFRSLSRGLAYMDAPSGTIIAYATAPGYVAADGEGRNSPYSTELLNYIREPGLKIEDVFKSVRIGVIKQTQNKQVPWEASSLTGDFYFVPPAPVITEQQSGTPVRINDVPVPKFRSMPLSNLSNEAAGQMIIDKGFYDKYKNESGNGFANDFLIQKNGQVVFDRNSGLMWQQSGSTNYINYENAQKYIDQLNRERFAGYSDWRLPTLEEAMSLMEPEKKNGELFIDPLFDKTQRWIWTADRNSASVAWYVYFNNGGCFRYSVDNTDSFARAVRS